MSVVTGPSAYLLSQLRVGDVDLVVGRMTDSPEIHGSVFHDDGALFAPQS